MPQSRCALERKTEAYLFPYRTSTKIWYIDYNVIPRTDTVFLCDHGVKHYCYCRVRVMVYIATFNNVSTVSWWSVLLVEETGVPEENHRPAASHRQTLSHTAISSTPRHGRECCYWIVIYVLLFAVHVMSTI